MQDTASPGGAAARAIRGLAPGLLLAFTIAAAARFLGEHYGAPVMLFALLIGMSFNFLATEGPCVAGIAFASSTVLRVGVALLGLRVTLDTLAFLAPATVALIVALVAVTIATGFATAWIFGRKWRFALLTGGSVAICGASAALALAAVIPPNDKLERNTLFTVVAVTTLSTVAMIAYPILFGALGLSDLQAGYLIGATIHDVAQVVGAGYTISDPAGELATMVKLIRVSLLPVVLLVVVLCLRARPGGGRLRVPAFVVAFAVLALASGLGIVPALVADLAADASGWLLVVAISAVGVRTSLRAMAEVGGGHVCVIVIETLVLLAAAMAATAWLWPSA